MSDKCLCDKAPWWLVVLISAFMVLLGLGIGYEIYGRNKGFDRGWEAARVEFRKEAILAGHGEFRDDPITEPVFHWKPKTKKRKK